VSTPNNRRKDPGAMGAEMVLLWVGIVVAVLAVVSVNVSLRVGHRLAGTPAAEVPADPFAVLFGVLGGDVTWPPQATWVLIALLGVAVVLAVLVGLWWRGLRRNRTRVDRAATYMGRGRDVEALGRKHATRTAARLGVTTSPGVPIGRAVADGRELVAPWEDMHVDIAGPRTGKTTSRVIPAILAAPGAVMTTSNKPDAFHATVGPRSAVGRVWAFDPQNVAGQQPTWWWNPLSYVTDEVKAGRLASHFAAATRAPGARSDAFFDGKGERLLAALLLAAALDERPLTDIYRWLTRPDDPTAAQVLTAHGYDLLADRVIGEVNSAEEQRSGVFGSAETMASFLTNRAIARWVTAGPGEARPHFDPAAFVRSADTLYSLSREGADSAGPLVTALTVAVTEAAEEYAVASPGARLATPLLGVLDEAANVCRWRDLPDLYSHYGSRGIVLMTFLQSWSQGVDVWGESGMKKLWSASNVKVYGGGVSETAFLEDLSRTIGDYDRQTSSVSTGKGHRTVNRQLHRERILEVAELAALPRGRAVVLGSGSRPTLVRTQPWMTSPHAAAVKASIAAHDPQAPATLADAQRVAAAPEGTDSPEVAR